MNDRPKTREYKNMLFDFYGALLTEKQREIYTMHHDEDCSLAEIGEAINVTPQAVSDTLKRADGKLNNYEKKLGLIAKHRIKQIFADEIEQTLDKLEKSEQVDKIRKALDKLML